MNTTSDKVRPDKAPAEMAMPEGVTEDRWLPFYCMQCGMGPCPARGRVVNGVIVKVEGNPDFKDKWPCPSLVCAMMYGVMQKVYNPYRIKAPMKRTNPKKGINEDPKFVEISWEEAMDTLVGKLKAAQQKGVVNEQGVPRVGSTQGPPQSHGYVGHGWEPFWQAWGPVERFSGGSGVKCVQTVHSVGEYWNRTFTHIGDYTYCNYMLMFGKNAAQNTTAGGSAIFAGHASSRSRGMTQVHICPTLNATGAESDEWIPIRVKTDGAFLQAMIYVVLHEMDWRKVCDIPFLKKFTNSPYLIGPKGYYLRDPVTKKPMVWDPSAGGPKPFNEAKDFALEGIYDVKGLELGPDGETYSSEKGTPSFQLLIEHVKGYTPEWASGITDVPADTIRRITKEFVEHANVGATVKVEGIDLPLRPVAIDLGRGVNNGWGSYQCGWSTYVLQMLVGSLQVPGGLVRTKTQMQAGMPFEPDEDGFLRGHLHTTEKGKWEWPPKSREGLNTLVPLSGTRGGMSARHLTWKTFVDRVENWPSSIPDVYFFYRNNPVSGGYDSNLIRKAIEKLPFVICVAATLNESNWYADLLLPEHTEMESYQLTKIMWKEETANWGTDYTGYLIRQPLVKPRHNTRDLTDIYTELADRLGILDKYNANINRMNNLKPPFALAPDKKYSIEEIMERLCRCASKGEHGLEWFKRTGGILFPASRLDWYLYVGMAGKGIRWEMPYQGRFQIMGKQLKRRLNEVGIKWWDHQASSIAQPLPAWEDIPGIYKEVYQAGPERDLWVTSHRASVFAGQQNFEVPWNLEIASEYIDVTGALIHPETARKKGLKTGDRVCLESVFGKAYSWITESETVRPDVISVYGFGTYVSPVSKEYGWPNPSELQGIDMRFFDETGASSDQTIVKIYKVRGKK